MTNYKRIIKDLIRPYYARIKDLYTIPYENRLIKQQQIRLRETEKQLKSKEIIKVVFLPLQTGNWKYDELYNLMLQHERFEPYIVLSPQVNKGKEVMIINLESMTSFFSNKGYKFISPYSDETGEWLDIKKEIDPDILFYTEPYKGMIYKEYEQTKFLDKLSCYASYGFAMGYFKWCFDLPFHNLLWMRFVENEEMLQYAINVSRTKGVNTFNTGYLGSETLIEAKKNLGIDTWKPIKNTMKRIMWAPHHSVKGGLAYSNFFKYHQFMIETAFKYKNKIQLVFNPHPILKNELYEIWGIEKTHNYYKKWEQMDNTQYNEGNYIDLFMHSDALIHDCGAFTYEYLYAQKPALYLTKPNHEKDLNRTGLEAYNAHYHAWKKEDITNFIDEVVINGNDPMKEQRVSFYNRHQAPREKSPSQNALDLICQYI